MKLKQILVGLENLKVKGDLDIEISGIENNSKNVKQGYFPGGCGVTTGERYTVYAFGYSNGVATTGLARVDILAQEGESASGSNAPSDSGQAGLPVGEMLEISQFNVECIASY